MLRRLSLILLLTTAFALLVAGCGYTLIPPLAPVRDPVITWQQPAPIDNPMPLSSVQLNATANVDGTFVYSPPAGTVLAPGMQTLSTTFTPTDIAAYNVATASVTLEVDEPGGGPPPMIDSNLAVSDQADARVLIYLAPLSSGMSPTLVLGQKDFTSLVTSEAANRLVGPAGLSMDAGGDLYVADAANCRIMRFPPPFTPFEDANLEVGVSSFTSPGSFPDPLCQSATPNNSLTQPSDPAVDAQGNLWVADPLSGRVLRFPKPLATAVPADLALGNSIDNMLRDCNGVDNDLYNPPRGHPAPIPPSATATSLCYPAAVAFDSNGDLWVADRGNNRVLEYMPPFSSGMPASLELGYPQSPGMNSPFTGTFFQGDRCAAVSAVGLCSPTALAFDSSGNLWVADENDHRVLEFSPPFSSGMAAALVLGQQDFTQAAAGTPAANTVGTPDAVSFDTRGDLFVSDGQDNRILIYAQPFSNGMNAIVVLGQPNMTTGGGRTCPPIAGNTLCTPSGVQPY